MMRLKWKKYNYTAQMGPGNSFVYRPLIRINISARSGGENMTIDAMIDSGTDSTVLNADIARAIGIDLSKCSRIKLGGIGSTEGYLSNVVVKVPDFKVVMDVPVAFAENPPFDGLLGQRHFFQRFKITFEKRLNIFRVAAV